MKIGIIVEPYEEHNASGIAHCILAQTRGLLRLDQENEYLIYTSVPYKGERGESRAQYILIPRSLVGKMLWFWKSVFFDRRNIPDVLVFNMPLLPLALPRRMKAAPIFYELSFPYPGEYVSLRRRSMDFVHGLFMRRALRRAAHIIVPSEATRDDIVGHYGVDAGKIAVNYLGFQDLSRFQDLAHPVRRELLPYFLFVGKVKYKKNLHGIVEGFIRFKKSAGGATHHLVIAGDSGGDLYERKIRERLRENGIEGGVFFEGYKYDEELYSYYRDAAALVFCSLQEGFGMPVIEAMYLGVPVITSNRSSLGEIAEGAALTVDPEKPEEIAEAMRRIADDNQLRAELVIKGKERARQFSWEKHVAALLEELKRIGSER